MSPNSDWYNRTLTEYMGAWERQVDDNREFGIEIEVEGRNLPRDNLTGWVIHEDGSLRGESAEYVFRVPENRTRVPERLAHLNSRFAEARSEINQSYRTSVHVHSNVRPWLIKHIYNNILLYIMCEDVFAELAGKDRIGNLFCLRAKDAEFFLETLRNAIVRDQLNLLNQDNLRYSAINPQSLFRHGSLEHRAFRGTTDQDLIQQWVDMIAAVRDASQRFDNPIKIVQDVSSKGAEGFIREIFSEEQISRFPQNWQQMIFDGAQLIQHAAYGHDWLPTDTAAPKKKKKSSLNDFYQAPVGAPQPVNIAGTAGTWQFQMARFEAPTQPAPQIIVDDPIDLDENDDWVDDFEEEEV